MTPVRAIDRAIDILKVVSAHPDGIKIAELQKHTDIARPTLYRIIATLENQNLVRQCDDPTRYALDIGVMQLARSWTRSSDLLARAEGPLTDLSRVVGETVALCLYRDGTRVFVREIVSQHQLKYSVGVGVSEPLTRGAGGLAILSFVPEAERDALIDRAPVAERPSLGHEIDTTRERGYAVSQGQVLEGATGIAAPVYDQSAQVCGSVGVYGPTSRLDARRVSELAGALLSCAQEISH